MSNGHIKHYLDQYMAMSQTDFAALITGEWGCGKTFFIDEYICELRNKGEGLSFGGGVRQSDDELDCAVRRVRSRAERLRPPERVERRVPDYSHGRIEFSRRHQRD